MRFLSVILLALLGGQAYAQDLPLFDAHIHYSHDAVIKVPPEKAAKVLREAGVKYALVSSSDDDGTQKLLAAAPEIVVPALRPYRRRGEIGSWMHDPTVIDYVEERLHADGELILQPLNLTNLEVSDLVTFLRSLTEDDK